MKMNQMGKMIMQNRNINRFKPDSKSFSRIVFSTYVFYYLFDSKIIYTI